MKKGALPRLHRRDSRTRRRMEAITKASGAIFPPFQNKNNEKREGFWQRGEEEEKGGSFDRVN